MGQPDEVRALFAGHSFGAPWNDADVRKAEAALGESLAPVLRELYLAFDGFRGPTNAAFFWPLFGREGLVEMNQFYRGDDLFPQELISHVLFYDDNGCAPQVSLNRDWPGEDVHGASD